MLWLASLTQVFEGRYKWVMLSCHTPKAKKHSDKKKHKVWAKYYSQLSSSEEDQSSVPIKKSTKPQQKAPSEPEHQQDSIDPVFYREVDLSDLPSQYAEEVETFRQILEVPDQ